MLNIRLPEKCFQVALYLLPLQLNILKPEAAYSPT